MGGPGTNKNLAQAIGEHKVVPQSVSGTSKPKGQRVEEAIILVTDRSEFLCVWRLGTTTTHIKNIAKDLH